MRKTLWYRLKRPTGTKGATHLRQHGSLKGRLVFPNGTNGGLRHRLKYRVSWTDANRFGFRKPVTKPVPLGFLNQR